ncbi:MAG: alkyl hydroperoxide reductase subunit [Oscillospiraceae bacterium]|jgi:thioredoxin reductase (NADPH)|nr:alkyl hydroperoxide reductase subunit [Oscillospiraceae bacterium]
MKELYDLIIIGSGSAGMTAGIYAGRSKLNTLIIERDLPGGQIKITSEVENYPGILHTSGAELSLTMKRQAENFGVKFHNAVVESVDFSGEIKKVKTVDGEYEALAVIIATGAVPRKIGFPGEEEFRGRGIGYCATCDGEFFSGMDVFVIGAGFAAAEESVFLTRYARKVTVIARETEFTCSKSIADRALAHPKIEVKFNTEIIEAGGDKVLRYAKFVNNKTGQSWRYDAPDGGTFGIFVFAGYVPQSAEYSGQVRIDEQGYIPTDENMRTNVDGVYAAGDIRPKLLRQLVTAVSDGAIAATSAEKYIVKVKEKLGIKNEETEKSPPYIESFFDDEMRRQLSAVLEKLETKIEIVAVLDKDNPLSAEIKGFLSEFSSLSDKITASFLQKGENPEKEAKMNVSIFPTIGIFTENGDYTGVQFHGVPGGHEINSFVLAVYNAAGPGQKITAETLEKILSVKQKVNFKIGVSLSCTLCPDVVSALQLAAIKNPLIEAEMIDVTKFPDFKNKYSILSVPAVVVNDEKIYFGKKSLEELLTLAGK